MPLIKTYVFRQKHCFFNPLRSATLPRVRQSLMHKFRTAARLALTTGLLAGVVAWITLQMHLIPTHNNFDREINGHTTQALAVALSKTMASNQGDDASTVAKLREIIRTCASLHRDIDQIKLTDRSGRTVFKTASKSKVGNKDADTRSMASVDIKSNQAVVGKVDIYFSNGTTATAGSNSTSSWGMILFLAAGVALSCWALFANALRYFYPSGEIPRRDISALDSLTEGVVLLKPSGSISHCNDAFCKLISDNPNDELVSAEGMVGKDLQDHQWQVADPKANQSFAWDQCLSSRKAVVGQLVMLKTQSGTSQLSVNASPILTNKGVCQGTLISFGNVTETENQRAALEKTLATVEEQNHQLSFLASYDPLTKCLNRREFFKVYDRSWQESKSDELNLLMMDVDHFKAINDTYGHSFGDKVLVHIAEQIRGAVGELGTVCRYGGEEFIVLLGDLEMERAEDVAHKIRKSIEATPVDGEVVTISVGLSNRQFKAMDQQHMLDQADKALYAAKRTGRNRVVRFDQCPAEHEMALEPSVEAVDKVDSEVEYSAVIGLLSSLSVRCQDTANHSVRVANLAVKIGREFIGSKDLYQLEIAALLHDVGKIGVPDAVLYKSGPLNEQEWEIMNRYNEMGLQIVGNTIDSSKIVDILRYRHYGYEPSHARPQQKLFREGIPVMSRILYVCDVFDSMVSDRAHKQRLLVPEALVELLKCCLGQLDEEIVRCLVKHVQENGYELTLSSDSVDLDPRSAVHIGSYVEVVYQALALGDSESLREISRSLRTHASKVFAHDLVDATINLEEAVNVGLPDEQIERVAVELMELCRETRQALIGVPSATKREGELEVN